MQSYFRNLIVWQKSFALSEKIYQITKNFPQDERYWLTDQMRRASISIASNIAEWSARWTNTEYTHFLHIAKWSASELITQALLCQSFW